MGFLVIYNCIATHWLVCRRARAEIIYRAGERRTGEVRTPPGDVQSESFLSRKSGLTAVGEKWNDDELILHESPREGGDPKITSMGEHFAMGFGQAFLNPQKRDSIQIFL